jgi:hypothetical protein
MQEYFSLCCALYEHVRKNETLSEGKAALPTNEALAAELCSRIKSHPIVERHYDDNTIDYFIIGVFRLLNTVLAVAPELRPVVGLSDREGLLKNVCPGQL